MLLPSVFLKKAKNVRFLHLNVRLRSSSQHFLSLHENQQSPPLKFAFNTRCCVPP